MSTYYLILDSKNKNIEIEPHVKKDIRFTKSDDKLNNDNDNALFV